MIYIVLVHDRHDGISPATDHNSSELPHVKAITPESQPGVEVSMLSFAWRNVTGLLRYIYISYWYILIHIDTYWYILIHIMLFSYLFIHYMHIIYKYNYTYIYIYVQMISQQSKVYSMDLFLFPYIYTVYIYMYVFVYGTSK